MYTMYKTKEALYCYILFKEIENLHHQNIDFWTDFKNPFKNKV